MLGSKYGRFSGQPLLPNNYAVSSSLNSKTPQPKFRFHKNLHSPNYNEFLAESDDEEFFNSKPRTRHGNDFDFDFKIDAYRDQIRFSKRKSNLTSQKKLLYNLKVHYPQEPPHQPSEASAKQGMAHNDSNDTELSYASIGANMSAQEVFETQENIAQKIPGFASMGPVNKTVLRCADGEF